MKYVNRLCEREPTLRQSILVSQSCEDVNSEPPEGGEEGEPEDLAVIAELKRGDSFLSQFGRYCPVCLSEGRLVMTDLSIASRFLGRIFFFESEKHRRKFAKDPLSFVYQQRPPRYPSPPNICVIGSPELAEYISQQFDAELIKPRDVIARVAQHETAFGSRVRDILARGRPVDAEIFKIALKAVLSRQDCQIRGYVLDGFPTRLEELNTMCNAHLAPAEIVIVEGEIGETKGPKIEKADESMIKFAMEEMHNVITIKNDGKIWKMGMECERIIRIREQERETAFLAMEEGRPFTIGALNISPKEVEENLSEFGHFCPVAKVSNEITVRSAKVDWNNIVKYNGKFYHPSSSEMRRIFLESPVPFVVHWGNWQPDFANITANSSLSTKKPEIEGYDIIELSRGHFIKGIPQMSCFYEDKWYWFTKKLHRDLFIKYTVKYSDIQLPAHRPVDQPPGQLHIQSMPTVAFLEQSVGNVVTECIVQLTLKRPKIPGETMEKSLNEYIAAYVKANIPEEKVGDLLHQRFVDQLNEIEEKVGLAAKLKQSLETPMEMRDEEEHERLCKLWEQTKHHK